jgi:carbonic anhydrase
MTAEEAKKKLMEGNERYVAGQTARRDIGEERRRDLADNGQHPFALIVSCADSRVPPELVFDQGLGELFVVRTAGNVLDDIGMGSVEYGAEHLHIPLIVVLGHEHCGAVKATVDSRGEKVHGCIGSVVDKISRSLEKVRGEKDLYAACEDENIRTVAAEIKNNPIVAGLMSAGKVTVACAKYGITSGRVTFF